MNLVRDQNALARLLVVINSCDKHVEERTLDKLVNQFRRRLRTGGEMRLTAQIEEFEME